MYLVEVILKCGSLTLFVNIECILKLMEINVFGIYCELLKEKWPPYTLELPGDIH